MAVIAYVFWHQPRLPVDGKAYEHALGTFHHVLSADHPEGLRSSFAFRQLSLPWASADAVIYEDWYLLDGFAALGTVNEAAVTGSRKASHDDVARDAEWGAGGVYRLIEGEASATVSFAYWLPKPEGWTYDRFLDVLTESPFEAIWQRQMVLGPAPEFCIHTNEQLDLEMPDILVTSPALVWPKEDHPE